MKKNKKKHGDKLSGNGCGVANEPLGQSKTGEVEVYSLTMGKIMHDTKREWTVKKIIDDVKR